MFTIIIYKYFTVKCKLNFLFYEFIIKLIADINISNLVTNQLKLYIALNAI